MAMAVRKEEEDEPPKGGELSESEPIAEAIRSIAAPKKVVEHGVYRISAPNAQMSHYYGAYRDSVEIPKATSAASISYDDEERNRLDTWLAHACPIDYTAAIKTRTNRPDPDKDWKDVDGIRVAAPQRLRKVKRLAKDEETGATYPVWELEPDTKLTPETFIERPAQYIDDWSELGVQRAKKAYLKRARASQEQRAEHGKSIVEPPTIPKVLVRRPPDLMWFLRNPDGQGLIYDEPYPNGIVDCGANQEIGSINREHNGRAAEYTNNLKYNGRSWGDADLRTIGFSLRYYQEMHPASGKERLPSEDISDDWYSGHHDLNAYKETLLNERTSEVDQHSRTEEVATGTIEALENLTDTIKDSLVQKGSKPQIMRANRGKIVEFTPVHGCAEKRSAVPLDHNEPEKGLTVVEGEYISANEPDYSPTNESTQLPAEMDKYITEKVHESFSSLREAGFQVVGSYPEGKQEIYLAGGLYVLDYEDPRTCQLLELLVEKNEGITKMLKNKLAFARLSQHDPEAWLDFNADGLMDDQEVELVVERVTENQKTMRPEPILHNQCEYQRYLEERRAEDRAIQNRKKFFEKSKRFERRRAKRIWMRERAARRQKLRDLATYHYKLLYEVRRIQVPMPQSKWAEVEWMKGKRDQFTDWRVQKRLDKVIKIPAKDHINDKVVMNALVFGMKNPLKGTKGETLGENVESIDREHVRTTRRRESIYYDRKMVFDDLVVPGTVRVPAEKPQAVRPSDESPIRAPSSGTVYSTKGVTRIHGGDYKTPLGKLWKKYITEFGGPPPRRYETEVKEHETVEETEHRDQQVGPGAYKPAEQRRKLDAKTMTRMSKRRAQRRARLAA